MRGSFPGVVGVSWVCVGLLLAPAVLHAGPSADWAVVLGLKAGTRVTVHGMDGSVLRGRLARVDPVQIAVLNLDAAGLSDQTQAYVLRTLANGEMPILERDGARLDLASYIHSLPQPAVDSLEVVDKDGTVATGIFLGGFAGLMAGLFAGSAVDCIGRPECVPGWGSLVGGPTGLVAGAAGGHKLATRNLGVIYDREAGADQESSARIDPKEQGGFMDSKRAGW
jgi:hypothetical protein